MTWCCDFARNAFESRLTYGEFIAAGIDPRLEQVCYFSGWIMCHRADYKDVVAAVRRAKDALEADGISNFKLSSLRVIHYCSNCGVRLQAHYGDDGGLLRDDRFIRELQESFP
jgi:hypothetical protein